MNLYTKKGDQGTTTLKNVPYIHKDDDRIELLGTIDELTSHIGLAKTKIKDQHTLDFMDKIQDNLMTMMAHIADQFNRSHKLSDEEVELVEAEIDRIEGLFERPKHFIKPGENPISAQLDVTRTVSRRAERRLVSVSKKFGTNLWVKQYMNRLADYFYVLARYYDSLNGENKPMQSTTNDVVSQVLKELGAIQRLTLEQSTQLITALEKICQLEGLDAVLAVCTKEGLPIAVHCMDNAFLVSYEVAMAKAYTSVALKMPTIEVAKLAQPGETFYGVDKMNDGKITIIGGGIPLYYQDKIVGGLGISGGTGEVDHGIALKAQAILDEILMK